MSLEIGVKPIPLRMNWMGGGDPQGQRKIEIFGSFYFYIKVSELPIA